MAWAWSEFLPAASRLALPQVALALAPSRLLSSPTARSCAGSWKESRQMPQLHPNFDHQLSQLRQEIAPIEGYLAKRDVHLLALAAAHPTSSGEVLEIGAFRGKSTVLLSK